MKTRHGMWMAARAAALAAGVWIAGTCVPDAARAEAILQVFNQSHNEIAARLPEIAEAGYTALWVPPPTKANGGMSVGYDLNDPFDIGNSDLRGTWSTRYGVEADLHNLIEMCHRFGMRVYFDNVMNHRSYDVPGYNESTPTDVYPGMCPEDFHLEVTSDGFYRKWPNIDWGNFTDWDVMNRPLSDLIDISHENLYHYDEYGNATDGPYNGNFGSKMGDWHLKPFIVRYAYHKEDTWKLFDRMPYPGTSNDNYRVGDGALQDQSGGDRNLYVGFNNSRAAEAITPELLEKYADWFAANDASNGVSMTLIENFPNFYKEQVTDYLNRAVRWLIDTTHVDGLRLDAVKHVPYDFFGATYGDDKNSSSYGYVGQAQWQFNMTRGFEDWWDHRNSVFNIDAPRDDLMAFGEHLGAPPPQGPYVDAGMRLVDDRLRNELNWRFSANELSGFDSEYAGSDLGPDCGVMHAQSHDNDYVDRKPLHHAMYFMRRGLGLVYSDGNNHAATLTGSGGAFPRWAQTDFLGQWGQKQIPTLLHAHENFARGGQWGKWSSGNYIAWQRGGEGSWATMLFMLNSAWDWWEPTKTAGDFYWRNEETGDEYDPFLYDYASDMYMPYYTDEGPQADYAYGHDLAWGKVNLPNNSYAIWAYKNPDPSGLYPSPYPECFANTDDRILAPDSRVITLMEDGKVVEPVMVTRKDGVDGDPNFNPYNVADTNDTDFSYTIAIPRVTGGTNVTLAVKADGSAEKMMLRLDGGMDFGNGISNGDNGDWRDAPPGMAEDFWLGFEDTGKWFTRRIWSEKFASVHTEFCKVGTGGATTYEVVIGGTPKVYENETPYDGPQINEPGFVYHDPSAETEPLPVGVVKAVPAAEAGKSEEPRASATWIGATYINMNGTWYKGDGQSYDDWNPPAFNGKSFGMVSGTLSLAGQCQTYGELDGEGNPARICYNILSCDEIVANGTGKLYWYDYKDNNNWFESRTGEGDWEPLNIDVGGLDDGRYSIAIWFEADGPEGTVYDNNSGANYVATFTIGEGMGVPQFQTTASGTVVWAKTSHEQGARVFLYYTTDGEHWPEGGGGVPANPATTAVEGFWKDNTESGSWWRFDLPTFTAGTTLRYKVSAFREMGLDGNGWGTIWPGDGNAIWVKKAMMSLWTIPGLNFETQEYHKHNDYRSWTKGFKDGYHLVTARMFLNRDDGAPVVNTFRQTFYLDTHTPAGEIMYPSRDGEEVGGSEYGVVVRTDSTVDEVWYHITDTNPHNDGPGNGVTSNGVEWARADQIAGWTKEMATDTEMPKVWRFTYKGVAAKGNNAKIRVRLREVSSVPAGEWSKEDPAKDNPEALHVTELTRTVKASGLDYYMYFDWPTQVNQTVEYNWEVRLKVCPDFAAGLDGDNAKRLFTVKLESPAEGGAWTTNYLAGSSEAVSFQWNYPQDSLLSFRMPNIYTGKDDDTHYMTITGSWEHDGTTVSLLATNCFKTKGPLLPTCIITTPPETDSDGVKYVITMEDSKRTAVPTNRALRETPIVVLTDAETTKLDLEFLSPTGYVASISATTNGAVDNDVLRFTGLEGTGTTSRTWSFAWQVTNAGTYRMQATVTADNPTNKYSSPVNTALRTATVQFRQLVNSTTNNLDWDDDGIANTNEWTQTALPASTDETWTQDQVFAHLATGKSDQLCPDTDGDGLPDGLELGYRVPGEGTDTKEDTNGDGWPNFIGDIDPPFYNTLPNKDNFDTGVISDAGTGADRTRQVTGSATDPRNPDSDGDGIPDGVEDANRNGWTDGDGSPFPTNYNPYREFNWANGKIDVKEVWEETSPCIWDSDADGLCDGYGEDLDFDGATGMALLKEDGTLEPIFPADYPARGIGIDNVSTANSSYLSAKKPYTSRAIDYDALFAAYNVKEPGKNGTMQSNGWPRLVITETDPLCTDTDHDGLPDGWETNYQLDPLNNGVYDFRTGQWTDDPTHGPRGNPDNDTYIQDGKPVPYDNAAEYLGGTNPRSSDNAGGGGPAGSITVGSGDPIGEVNGTTYFTEATEWTLGDLVALDNYNQGGNSSDIYRFGDGYDSSRDMVAFYFRDGGDSAEGGDDRLYFRVDFDDLQAFAEDGHLNVYVAMNFGNYGNGIEWLPDDVNCKSAMKWNAVSGVYDSQNGCVYVKRDGEDAYDIKNDRFLGAWFNSELDTVVWSIDRKALTEAKWNGKSDKLTFQVYTTRDFTNDDGGSGDKGGLNDFADTIGDDWLCSDYWNDYAYIAQNGIYRTSVGFTPGSNCWNNCGRHAKLAMVAHGNQAIEPGNVIQGIVDNGSGAGYGRPVRIHNIYTNCPLNLHITPTLAIALQWAEAGTEKTWYSGPALNAAIRKGVASGALALLGTTFSDHIPMYFPDDFNAADIARATDVLESMYGSNAVSRRVLWSPERVADAGWLARLGKLGYQATLVDQTPHLLDWFGRETSLGNDAYKIQRFWLKEANREMKAFALSSAASGFRYVNTDGGLASDLRRLFLRRARGGDAAISSIFYMWEDFAGSENADAYDRSLRWIANHPWIQVVTLEAALDDKDGLAYKDNLAYNDLSVTNGMAMQDWIHHACNGSYDNWYYGSARHESLSAKKFEVREGESIPTAYGTATNGILRESWEAVKGIGNPQLRALAEATIFASAFETAFHNESNGNLARWSYGEYMYPATEWEGLMSMAWRAQSRTRLAAVYKAVDEWVSGSKGLEAFSADIDLDGEPEWILRNDSVMAVFEAEGGLMVGAWFKQGTDVWQVVGNFAAQPETGYETQSAGTDSTRGTAMKDLKVGANAMTAVKYAVTAGTGTLTFKADGVTKTVKLANASTNAFAISYNADGKSFRIRNGLSPDLATLMLGGQARLSETPGTNSLTLTTTSGDTAVAATVRVTAGTLDTGATDMPEGGKWNTVNLRNAPQVRQVDVIGTGNLAYEIGFDRAAVSHAPPTIAVTPPGDQVFPVGGISAFRVTATDWQGNTLPVEVTDMPLGSSLTGTPAWDADSGVFSWKMGPPSDGSRTNDISFRASFAASDADDTVTADVTIIVPWDADGNGMGDDWEYVARRKTSNAFDGKADGDADGDGFVNSAEWEAGTDPADPHDYIGWEEQAFSGTNITYLFHSVSGRTYDVQSADLAGLRDNQWSTDDTITAASSETLWTAPRAIPERVYRLRIHPR